MTKCSSCNGTYTPVQADGTLYFHRCPPLSAVELQLAVLGGKVVLPVTETVADAVNRRVYERPSVRDENLPSTSATDRGRLKLSGLGVTVVADPAPAIVVVSA